MRTINKKIACQPFPSKEIKTSVSKGVLTFNHKTELTKLTVVFDSENFFAGDSIYLPGECVKNEFAGKEYQKDGKQFILVPEELVVGYDPRTEE